ncbi:unnamed protein product, partial [marine sediment metagenome]
MVWSPLHNKHYVIDMNEEEIRELYEELSELYGVPMPTWMVYDRRPK